MRAPAPYVPDQVSGVGLLAATYPLVLWCLYSWNINEWNVEHRDFLDRVTLWMGLPVATRASLLMVELLFTPPLSLFKGSSPQPWSLVRVRALLRPLPFEDIKNDQGVPDDTQRWTRFVDLVVAPVVHSLLCLLFLYDLWLFLLLVLTLPRLATAEYRAKRGKEVQNKLFLPIQFVAKCNAVRAQLPLPKQLPATADSAVQAFVRAWVNMSDAVSNNSDLLCLTVLFVLYVLHILNRSPWRLLTVESAGRNERPLLHSFGAFMLPTVLEFSNLWVFGYVHCALPRPRRALWRRFDSRDSGHMTNTRSVVSFKLNEELTSAVTNEDRTYLDVAQQLERKLDANASYKVFHYYGTCGLHFASIIEFKNASTGRAELVLRLEYHSSRDAGVHPKDDRILRTVLNVYDHSECVHVGNQQGRTSFPEVILRSIRGGTNHRFNDTPLWLNGRVCGLLLRECLLHASHPPGRTENNYSLVPDPTKGTVNCFFYAAKFGIPVMTAYKLGFFADGKLGWPLPLNSIWLRLTEFKGTRTLRVLQLVMIYLLLVTLHFAASSSSGTVTTWLTRISLYVTLAIATYRLVPLQLGALCTMARGAYFEPKHRNWTKIHRGAFVQQLGLMLVWPFGPIFFHWAFDIETLYKWVEKACSGDERVCPKPKSPGWTHRIATFALDFLERRTSSRPLLTKVWTIAKRLLDWREGGYEQSSGQRKHNEIGATFWNRLAAAVLCPIFPVWNLLSRTVTMKAGIGSAFEQAVVLLKPVLELAAYSPMWLASRCYPVLLWACSTWKHGLFACSCVLACALLLYRWRYSSSSWSSVLSRLGVLER